MKLVLITPHLSTGGLPQFLLNKIQMLSDIGTYDLYCIEYEFLSPHFVVQRNRVKELLGHKFISISEFGVNFKDTINSIKPDIIWVEEFSEYFMNNDDISFLFNKTRYWKLIESTHTSDNLNKKKYYLPDKFVFVSPHSVNTYKNLGVPYDLIEYPVDYIERNSLQYKLKLDFDTKCKHILNVGLFTRGKNQGYAFQLADRLLDYNIKFHFVGNLAENFRDYWEPVINNKPLNCTLHGERDNVSEFLQASDLFLFTSIYELNPIVLREALSHKLPILMFNLETYHNSYDDIDGVHFLSGKIDDDVNMIIKLLNMENTKMEIEYEISHRNEIPTLLNQLKLTGMGVEVGSFKGEFAKHISRNWNGKLYMIDVWRELSDSEYTDASNNRDSMAIYESAMKNIDGFEDKTFMLRMRGELAKDLFVDESLDFVYIDANHSYDSVKRDIEDWYPKVKKGGLVMGHDYLPSNLYNDSTKKDIDLYTWPNDNPSDVMYAGIFGVNSAVDEFALKYGYTIKKTEEFFATWWVIKK